ncbi:MAG: zinc-ribbon domain-containing protein [Epsilonproteobacteria bacterium]|nr:hypothetical protein [Campylobacterota bacterium]NPA56567.1 zinc-ribbon domain-containing protein [Campylobacterota bacterium]
MGKLKKWWNSYKKALFYQEGKPLSFGAHLAIFTYLFFVLWLVGKGIDFQTSFLQPPYRQFGHLCIDFAKRVERAEELHRELTELVPIEEFDRRLNGKDLENFFGSHPLCQKLGERFLAVLTDLEIRSRLKGIERIKGEIGRLRREITQREKQYSSMLLERIAQVDRNRSILVTDVDHIKREIEERKRRIAQLEREMRELRNISSIPNYREFISFLRENGKRILQEQRRAYLLYTFNYLLYAYSFLIPAFLIFWFLYRLFQRKRFQILQKLALHTLNVIALFMIYYLAILIYEVIPKVWLRKFLEWLQSLNLQFLFSIGGILLLMGLFWLIIAAIQRRSQSPSAEKGVKYLYLRDGRCGFCGARPRQGDRYCSLCGRRLFHRCPQCGNSVPAGAPFCPHCGGKNSLDQHQFGQSQKGKEADHIGDGR